MGPLVSAVTGKKTLDDDPCGPSWQEGASGLLLLAAAQESGLLCALSEAIPCSSETASPRLARIDPAPRLSLLLTLLFMAVVGLRRTWDLRSYVGDTLAFLTGRPWAYGYRHVERFLSDIANAGAGETLTDALAHWTHRLWQREEPAGRSPLYYIDGHRKPVYSEARIPRGLIGRTGAIEGCRALVLLHDAQGHPLLATTHRGDQHLTLGLPQIMARYAQATDQSPIRQVVVDREGMGGNFLAGLVAMGVTVVTILRTDQYDGLTSFTEVGPFVPLTVDSQGEVVREVAAARFALPIPARPGEPLPLSVALIRDLRCQVATPADDDLDPADWVSPREQWLADLPLEARDWWEADWVATPAPAAPLQPKLIPIVSTAGTRDAVTLAQTYLARWPQQENIIRDFLLPLGLDTNHGYAKTPIENSEQAKQRTRLEQRRDRLQRWADSARKRYQRACQRADRRYAHRKARGELLYRELNQQQDALAQQEADPYLLRRTIRTRKAAIDAELDG
ncbi:MAG TPA: hypothetical protein VGC99_12990, partial [Candidatus Tectomicrobia bacterium]